MNTLLLTLPMTQSTPARRSSLLLGLLLGALLLATPAHAKRLALVLGNAAFQVSPTAV